MRRRFIALLAALAIALSAGLVTAGPAPAASPSAGTAGIDPGQIVCNELASGYGFTLPPPIELRAGDCIRWNRAVLVMQHDGNLVLYHDTWDLWHTRTTGYPGAYALLWYDGNIYVIAPGAGIVYSSEATAAA